MMRMAVPTGINRAPRIRLRVSSGLAAALPFAILYLAFPTRKYYWDGISFALLIERTANWHDLFNVHHLLYNFIGYAEYRLLGRAVRALYLMQWTNCVAGGLLVWLAYRLFRSFNVPAPNSAACAVITGAAAYFWRFTTDADSYILANVFLVAAYLAMRRSLLPGALLHICAMTMHQLAALFYPVGLALIWQRSRERFWQEAATYTLVSAGGVLALYATAYRLAHDRAATTFTGWLTFHAKVPFFFNAWRNARWLAIGTARLFVGGRLLPAALIAGPVAIALMLVAMAGLARNRSRFSSVHPGWPLIVWTAAYLGFLFFWEPYNTFYRLFYLVPLTALLALATRAMPARPLAMVAAALLCWNFFTFIYPNTRVENNEPLACALRQQKHWPAGTAVIYAEDIPDLWTIRYFNPQVSWILLDQPDPARVAAYATRNAGQVYLDWTYLHRAGEPAPRFAFRPASPASAR